MKKKFSILLFTLTAAILFSGCSEKKDTELDDIINNLPSVPGNPLISLSPNESDNSVSYVSVNGTVKSVSKDSISLQSGDKFYINEDTSIFGGSLAAESYVTVTYNEADKSEKKIFAVAITVLNGEAEVTTTITAITVEENESESSEEVSAATEVADSTTEEEITTDIATEITSEITSEDVTEITESDSTSDE